MPDGVKGRYTGAHCPPETRQAIKDAILNQEPIQAIVARTGACAETVMVVRDQELPDWRKQSTVILKETVHGLITHFRDTDPENIPWAVKPVMFGILMDKIALLEGEPTQIVEHRHTLDMSTLLPPETAVIDVTDSTCSNAIETNITPTLIPEQSPES